MTSTLYSYLTCGLSFLQITPPTYQVRCPSSNKSRTFHLVGNHCNFNQSDLHDRSFQIAPTRHDSLVFLFTYPLRSALHLSREGLSLNCLGSDALTHRDFFAMCFSPVSAIVAIQITQIAKFLSLHKIMDGYYLVVHSCEGD